ncbi:MAG TPA: hypothetical protein VLF94_05970 [Chlamydiales bacterium]|nr:hypothetical protein [Chlamydiales bacterium]
MVAKPLPLPPEPTTSGYLRFVNIWNDAFKRHLIGTGAKNLLVLGPGKREFGDQIHCPQMAEALRLWGDGSHFTVLDSNPSVLKLVESVDHKKSQEFISETFRLNPTAEQCRDIHRLLTAETKPEYTLVTKEFRMGKDKLPRDFQPVDLALATLSLYYPLKTIVEQKTDSERELRIQLLGEYLIALKPGGVMYVDEDTVLALLVTPDDIENAQNLQRLLTPQNISALKEQVRKSTQLDVEFVHLPQIGGLRMIQGRPFVDQPSLVPEIQTAAQTKNAFAIIRK